MSLRHAILGILDYRDMHGYELVRVLQEGIGLIWPVHHSSLYPNLHRLEAEGLISHRAEREGNRPERKVYSITSSGREDLHRWLHEPPEFGLPEARSPFFLKLIFTRAENLEEVLTWIEKELSGLEQRAEQFQASSEQAAPMVVDWLQELGHDWTGIYASSLRDLRERLRDLSTRFPEERAKINAALRGQGTGGG